MEYKIGAFFVHGFMGYPTDFGNLSVALEKLNIDTKLIILPGHDKGENPSLYSWKNWLSYAEERYLEYKEKLDIVYLIGFSMGGTIATYLANKHGCDKLVLIAPAFEYFNPIQNIKDIKLAFKRRYFSINKIKAMMKQELGYQNENKIKFKTYRDFIMLTKYCIKNIGYLDIPIRIYHGENDELIPLSSSMNALKRFTNQDKKLDIIPYGRHMLLTGASAKVVESSIAEFLSVTLVKEEATIS
ncbi:TPA: alpha/beta fold hydrolase [bacterium]|jgi:esterase/lipase|nr:alpha/beta fold hydrolase [bacterium]